MPYSCVPLNHAILSAAGDISLGSWTVAEQGKRPDSPKAAADRPAEEVQPITAQHAKQADTAAGSGDMDLTNYFAMLPNEVVPFRDLISPLPVSASCERLLVSYPALYNKSYSCTAQYTC